MISKLTASPKKIAILRAIMLGDLLVTVPIFRALRQAFPKAEIFLISLPWAKEFVKRFSKYLDIFLEFPGLPSFPEQQINPKKVLNFWQRMQDEKFDLVFQMQGDGSVVNPFIELVGAKSTAGYFKSGDYCPNPQTFLPYPENDHEIRKHLKLLKFLGIPHRREELEFPIFKSDEIKFKKNMKTWKLQVGNYALVHPGAQLEKRRWDSKKFAKVGHFLARKGLQVVLTGTKKEKKLTRSTLQQMNFPVVDLAGKTDLGQIGLLIKNAGILVANDTSVSHIAAAFKTPSVIISHINKPQAWAPLNKNLHKVIPVSQASLRRVYEEINRRIPITNGKD